MHADRRTHNGSQTSKFKDDDCVRWSDLVQGFIARLRETPDAATSNTFSPNVATMLWAVAKYNAAEAALAIPDADAAATVSATPVGGAGSGGVDVDVDVFVNTLGDVDLMAYFILLQYVRNRLCVDGTAKAADGQRCCRRGRTRCRTTDHRHCFHYCQWHATSYSSGRKNTPLTAGRYGGMQNAQHA